LSVRKTAWILLVALFCLYSSISPGTVGGRGYVWEEVESGLQMLASFNAWFKGRPPQEMVWSRHGPIGVLLDLPFIKLGKMLVNPDFIMSFQSSLLTAALMMVVFLWLRKLCSPRMSFLLTLSGAFATMLWPYAYIGLEVKQSFLVLLAGYLALACGPIRGWLRLVFWALICGFAVAVKSTGIVLVPVVAYLVYVQFRDDWRRRLAQLAAVVLVIAAVWYAGKAGTDYYWGPLGGGVNAIRQWMIDTPFAYVPNAIGMLGSPTKGLFVFAPPLLLALYAWPRAWRTHREIAIFALLVTACTVGFMSLMMFQTDEVWGPRYLHVAIAPLLLCMGAALPRFQWRRDLLLVALSLLGFAVSFLGAFYYYGTRNSPTYDTAQNTMEWLIGDMIWNEVTFSARLFRVWLEDSPDPVPWTAQHVWVWAPPPDGMPWKTVDLRKYCKPQSFLIENWSRPQEGTNLRIFRALRTMLYAGLLALAWFTFRSFRDRTLPPNADPATLRS
jgi:hypothetical protein